MANNKVAGCSMNGGGGARLPYNNDGDAHPLAWGVQITDFGLT